MSKFIEKNISLLWWRKSWNLFCRISWNWVEWWRNRIFKTLENFSWTTHG